MNFSFSFIGFLFHVFTNFIILYTSLDALFPTYIVHFFQFAFFRSVFSNEKFISEKFKNSYENHVRPLKIVSRLFEIETLQYKSRHLLGTIVAKSCGLELRFNRSYI